MFYRPLGNICTANFYRYRDACLNYYHPICRLQYILRLMHNKQSSEYIHWSAHCAGFKVHSCRSMSLCLPRFELRRRRICSGRLQIMVSCETKCFNFIRYCLQLSSFYDLHITELKQQISKRSCYLEAHLSLRQCAARVMSSFRCSLFDLRSWSCLHALC